LEDQTNKANAEDRPVRSGAMKKPKRGHPRSILTRMKGEDRTEIRLALKYGTRAWRFVLLRQLLGDKKGLPENYFSWLRSQPPVNERERETMARKYPAWKSQLSALRHMRQLLIPAVLHLWETFVMQFERALLCHDEDWLLDLAKVLREETSPQRRDQFTAKVIALLDYCSPNATVNEIYDLLDREEQRDFSDYIYEIFVEGHRFENRYRVIEAIQDIADEIGFTFPPRRPASQR
jgi:hypothetical protein